MATRQSLTLAALLLTLAAGTATLLVSPEAAARPRHVRVVRHHRAPERRVVRTSEPTPSPLYLGVGLLGTSLTEDYDFPDLATEGSGLQIYGGVRLSPRAALELGWMGAQHDRPEDGGQAALQAGTLDLRLTLGRLGALETYLLGGLGIYGFSSPSTRETLTGPGVQFGAGIDLHLSRSLALSARGSWHGAQIDDATETSPAFEEAYLGFVEGSLRVQLGF